jgi:hypothetical protein
LSRGRLHKGQELEELVILKSGILLLRNVLKSLVPSAMDFTTHHSVVGFDALTAVATS